ncbi:hypothetical protein KOR34_10500 [Posidoniimonas corsicana]|uniref:CNNM transmembrane domain-containing protein n=1 Tax=Posidoniimonas corsicana TaxID=1938618 RepID=A0A5C5VD72_9BACT|nr:CNNM domain-containing protein [Posidoniimonas corsicana]TWT36151.1 hypothetical protein KOR34_10500 [Posidoniimonas corsicana]
MWLAILLFAVGLTLSAFFSGSETGFYRVARVRVLIDAMSGSRIAKMLLWAINNPAAFVATALVGNNVANYVVSCATVLFAQILIPGGGAASEMGLTIALAPVVFIYGELLPKQLFFAAPNRLLRGCAPGLSVAAVLFAPVSAALWVVGFVLQRVARVPSQALRMELARRELGEVLDEGHAVGLLSPAQRRLAQGTFAAAARSIREFMIPVARLPQADPSMNRRELVRFARRRQQTFVVLRDGAGYVRVLDCLLDPEDPRLPIRELLSTPISRNFLATLLNMQSANREVAAVRDQRDRIVGYVFAERLRTALAVDQGP